MGSCPTKEAISVAHDTVATDSLQGLLEGAAASSSLPMLLGGIRRGVGAYEGTEKPTSRKDAGVMPAEEILLRTPSTPPVSPPSEQRPLAWFAAQLGLDAGKASAARPPFQCLGARSAFADCSGRTRQN